MLAHAAEEARDPRLCRLHGADRRLGFYGALSAAKYHERAEYHLQQARALTRALADLGRSPTKPTSTPRGKSITAGTGDCTTFACIPYGPVCISV